MSSAFPFSIPTNIYVGSAAPFVVRAEWMQNIPAAQEVYTPVVAYQDSGTSPAGLYIFHNGAWRFAIPYDNLDDFVISGGSINLYLDLVSAATPPSGALIFRNGVQTTASSLDPNANVVWATIFTNPTTGAVAGVSSFNTRTGAVTLQASDLPIATGSTLGAIKVGSGLAVAGDGTLSTTGGYVLPVATTTVLGGVKQGSGVTVAGDGTLSAAVTSVAGKTGNVAILVADVSGAAPLVA